jgi:hypothetical protein
MLLRNHYGVEMGTSGLIVQAQSREEILADKLVALALRPNRLKNRDLWDIGWLKQQNITLPLSLIPNKIADHKRSQEEFTALLGQQLHDLADKPEVRKAFIQEMRRFLPPQVIDRTVEKKEFWGYLTDLISAEGTRVLQYLQGSGPIEHFSM